MNQSFAKRYFPNQDLLGHSVRVPDLVNHPPGVLAAVGSNEWTPIIAVVGDVRNSGLQDPVKYESMNSGKLKGSEIAMRKG